MLFLQAIWIRIGSLFADVKETRDRNVGVLEDTFGRSDWTFEQELAWLGGVHRVLASWDTF